MKPRTKNGMIISLIGIVSSIFITTGLTIVTGWDIMEVLKYFGGSFLLLLGGFGLLFYIANISEYWNDED